MLSREVTEIRYFNQDMLICHRDAVANSFQRAASQIKTYMPQTGGSTKVLKDLGCCCTEHMNLTHIHAWKITTWKRRCCFPFWQNSREL